MANQIVIKKGLKIGQLDAEADKDLLDVCFVDNGQLDELVDVSQPSSIIVGRTGAGKSALLHKISKSVEYSAILDPHAISIQFIENSNIIQFFNQLGVKLDLFYKLLWRHILIVELLKVRYELRSEVENSNLINRLLEAVKRDEVKQRAVAYFREWGDKFWLETSEHLQEITKKLTQDLKVGLGAKYKGIEVSGSGAKLLSNEIKTEVKSLATQVVSSIQVQRLTEMFNLLSEFSFNDRQKRFYILIDKLDEDWASTDTRCRLIRALIEETKSFRNIPQVKIITALRADLLDLVFDKTRDSGFQQEKYESYIVRLHWTKTDLINVINRRIQEVYKRQYTSHNVSFKDVFPSDRNQEDSLSYILDRTLMRPRDAIQFINECFVASLDQPRISWRSIAVAEATYSIKRLNSLREEWYELYPNLETTFEMLRGLTSPFTRTSISQERVEKISEELALNTDSRATDPCVLAAMRIYEAKAQYGPQDFLWEVLLCLYHVGVIGTKISTLDSFIWSYRDQPRLTKGEVKRTNQIAVHKMVCHALEITEQKILNLPKVNTGKRTKQIHKIKNR
jgi:hypothetical protein